MAHGSASQSSGSDDGTYSLYGYTPSLGAAVFFLAGFGLLTLVNAALVAKSRVYWLSVICVGGALEVIGWSGRASRNPQALNPFLIQQICLVLAPCFFSAALYGLLGKMLIPALGTQFSRIQPRLYLVIFCVADFIAIVIQAIGGGMAAIGLLNNNQVQLHKGTNIMVGGIVVQLVAMVVFSGLAIDYWIHAKKDPGFAQKRIDAGRRLELFVGALAFGSACILLRCIYRTIELAQGWTGYLITHQAYFIVLDSIPMLLVMSSFVVGHPYFCLSLSHKSTNDVEEGREGSVRGSMEKGGSREGENEEVGDAIETPTHVNIEPTRLPASVDICHSVPVTATMVQDSEGGEEKKETIKDNEAPI